MGIEICCTGGSRQPGSLSRTAGLLLDPGEQEERARMRTAIHYQTAVCLVRGTVPERDPHQRSLKAREEVPQ